MMLRRMADEGLRSRQAAYPRHVAPSEGLAPFQEAENGSIDDVRVGNGAHMAKSFELDDLHAGKGPCQQPGNAEG